MHEAKSKVLIVDDSLFMGQVLKKMLIEENFTVEIARNGKDAIEKLKTFQPNVITMDVEMPVMSGVEALQIIMEEQPLPVIMVSVQTIRGAEISLRALELGAFDFVTKPSGEAGFTTETFRRELVAKLKIACLVPPEKLKRTKQIPKAPEITARPIRKTATNFSVLAIGTSTGGPSALQTILTQLPRNFPLPILVVQHMPKNFTKMMAERLNSLCELEVLEAGEGDAIVPGRILIAPGGLQMVVRKSGQQAVTHILQEAPIPTPYRPSANVMFTSVAEVFGGSTMAMLLTGMGSDGLEGAKLLKQRGAYLIAESEETCIVYGMAKCIVDAGIVDQILPLPEIGRFLIHKNM
ncbi:MAG: chemotaxis response regulator protein-glutamate methylesterase [Peptococcaceae bacterium]|nr:chemotaxis response regulator protein-glutamate methylesterase [Peptococcaceae bacterium]